MNRKKSGWMFLKKGIKKILINSVTLLIFTSLLLNPLMEVTHELIIEDNEKIDKGLTSHKVPDKNQELSNVANERDTDDIEPVKTNKVQIRETRDLSKIEISEDINNSHILVNGNVTIEKGAVLRFFNVSLEFNGTTENHGIYIQNGSSLLIYNSTISLSENLTNNWFLLANNPEQIEVNHSTFLNVGFAAPFNNSGITIINNTQTTVFNNVSFEDCINNVNLINTTGTIVDASLIINSNTGIYVINSNNVLVNDTSFSNLDNQAILAQDSSFTSIKHCTVNIGQQEGNIPAIRFINVSNSEIFDNTLFGHGLELTESVDIQVSGNSITATDIELTEAGIEISNSSNLLVTNNRISGAVAGFIAVGGFAYAISISDPVCSNVSLYYNHLENFAGWGVRVIDCSGLSLNGNVIERDSMQNYHGSDWNEPEGGIGLFLAAEAGEEEIKNNTFNDLKLAIYFENETSTSGDYSNTVFHLNNFIDNTRDFEKTNVIKTVDWSKNNAGNHWSHLIGIDIDENGIIDQPYDLLGTSEVYDNHPLYYPNYNPLVTLESLTDVLVENRIDQYVEWSIEDDDALNYKILFNNGTIQSEGALNGNLNISLSLIGWKQDNYSLECLVVDRWQNNGSDIVNFQVDVADYDNPSLEVPSMVLVKEFAQNATFTWNASDFHPYKFNITIDGTLHREEYWADDNITFALNNLDEGIYELNITVFDVLIQKNSSLVTLNVTDFGPVITGTEEINVAQDNVITLSWYLYDKEPNGAILYVNETEEGQTPVWTSGGSVSYDFNASIYDSIGIYLVKILANDTENKQTNFTTIVNVLDNIFPSVIPDENNTAEIDEFITDLQTFNWTASDRNPANYSIWLFRNGTWEKVKEGLWNSTIGNLTYILDPQDYNVTDYRLQARVTDQGGNTAVSTGGGFSIVDTTFPVFVSSPGNMTIEYGGWTHLEWNFTDNHPENYQVFINNSIQVFEWNGSLISFYFENTTYYNSTDPLEDQLANYTIIVRVIDAGNNQANETIVITVRDTTLPVVDHVTVSDIDILVNETDGNQLSLEHYDKDDKINFLVIELLPDHYYLAINGEIVVNQTLVAVNDSIESHIIILYSLIPIGNSAMELCIVDHAGNVQIYLFNVNLLEPIDPILTETPADKDMDWPDHIVRLVWSAWDLRPGTYVLWLNGTVIKNDRWEKYIYLTIEVQIGFNIFNISINDTSGNTITDSVQVVVKDINKPIIYYFHPLAFVTLEEGENLTLTCQATDEQPWYFEVLINGTIFTSRSWYSTTSFEVTISNLSIGYYELLLILYDQSGNTQEASSKVKIIAPPPSTSTVDQRYATPASLQAVILAMGLLSIVHLLKNMFKQRKRMIYN
ncbi:MAG: right-handed parallel beta-helix repeat-containing protein [Candidatus Hodarchaeales archaeon]|jgi:nitrous oxidase accessory protein NosD